MRKCSKCGKIGHNRRTCIKSKLHADNETILAQEEKITIVSKHPSVILSDTVNIEDKVVVKEDITIVDKVCDCIATNIDEHITLLRNREVIMWIFGYLSFFPSIKNMSKTSTKAKYKLIEDEWGRAVLKTRRPDLKLDKQWTNKFGEHLCEEIYALIGKDIYIPLKKNHYQPDFEVDNAIIEAKTGTFYTDGTAGEKILGCPFKYADIPELYNKTIKNSMYRRSRKDV